METRAKPSVAICDVSNRLIQEVIADALMEVQLAVERKYQRRDSHVGYQDGRVDFSGRNSIRLIVEPSGLCSCPDEFGDSYRWHIQNPGLPCPSCGKPFTFGK